MKYRIKIVTRGTGEKTYYPQYKKFLFWRNFKELVSICSSGPNVYHDVCYDDYDDLASICNKTYTTAIERADSYIKKHKEKIENEKRYNKKEISYIYEV